MIIKKIIINNFKNISFTEIEPTQKINIINGQNAQGKTNLIEAIWLFTGMKSFRGSKDAELIKFGQEKCNIQLEFFSEGIEKQAEIVVKDKKEIFLNQKKLKNGSDIAGEFNAVVFNPNDLLIISGSPKERRKFLDICIGQIYQKYINILKEYTRAVKQRNNLLKESIKDSTIEFLIEDFEKIIVSQGKKIIDYRKRYIDLLKQEAIKIYNGISGNKEILEIEYLSSVFENFQHELILARKTDKFKGITSVGPHRDDIIFKINGQNAKEFSSQGQKRSIALSLKLAEAKIIEKIIGESPIILLDDVLSELDKNRRNFILNEISNKQVFISCCEEDNFKELKNGKIFEVKEGSIEKCIYI